MAIDPALDPDEPFRALVARAAKGQATDAEREMLVSDGVRERFRAALISLKRDADAQLVERQAYIEAYKSQCMVNGNMRAYHLEANDYRAWRAALLRYRNGLEERLAELRAQFGKGPATGPGAEERRRRGEDIDVRLGRIEEMVAQLLEIARART